MLISLFESFRFGFYVYSDPIKVSVLRDMLVTLDSFILCSKEEFQFVLCTPESLFIGIPRRL